jgi:hypothetical protein
LKKIRALLGLCVILVALGGAFALKRKSNDDLQPLLRYATEQKTLYFDPASLYASMPGFTGKPPASALQPMQIRSLKLQNISYEQVSKILHRELSAKRDWHFEKSFATLKSAPGDLGFISAYQGTKPSPTSLASPNHVIMVMPDFSSVAFSKVMATTAPKAAPPSTYTLIEMRQLAPWEIAWLKVKRLGRNPYSDQSGISGMFAP